MNLSPNFTLAEMVISQEAARKGIPNDPSEWHLINLRRLCNEILEPLRAELGKPIMVSSGFRSKAVNNLVGGSESSDHIYGRAADISVPSLSPREVCEVCIRLNLPFRQLILEFDRWTHISIDTQGITPRREVLTAKKVDFKTAYQKGLT